MAAGTGATSTGDNAAAGRGSGHTKEVFNRLLFYAAILA